jgi:hypothetical protein
MCLKDYLRVYFSTQHTYDISKKSKTYVGLVLRNRISHNNINSYYKLTDATVNQMEQVSICLTPNVNIRISF